MQRKLFLLPLSILMACVVIGQKPFTIKGNIAGKPDGYIYLTYQGENGYVSDSAVIENGKFSFAGKLQGPVQAAVMIDRKGRSFDKYTQLYIVPANMELSLVYDKFDEEAKLTGSPVQKQADELKKSKASLMAQMKPMMEAYNRASAIYSQAIKDKKDEATLARLKDEANNAKDAMDPLRDQINKLDIAFMDKYPASIITANMLRFATSRMKLDEAESRYNKLSPEIKSSALGKSIKEDIDGLRGGSPGAQAFQFASKELRGEELKLTDFKGKYVLLDFWASWCVPCRKGNPHLLTLYAKYKDKGLEIIGVSDDDSNNEAWKKAVEKDQIGVWKHVLRGLKRVDGPAMFDRSASISDRYGIHTLPTKILVDPNGIIIGRFGGGGDNDEAMDKKLSEIFGG